MMDLVNIDAWKVHILVRVIPRGTRCLRLPVTGRNIGAGSAQETSISAVKFPKAGGEYSRWRRWAFGSYVCIREAWRRANIHNWE